MSVFGAVSAAIILAVFSENGGVMGTEASDRNGISPNTLFDFCRFRADDYPSLEAMFMKTYPVGSSSQKLIRRLKTIQDLEQKLGGQPLPNPERQLSKILGSNSRNVILYTATKKCEIGRGNMNWWGIIFVTDGDGKIIHAEYRIFYYDDNFDKRGIAFDFDRFNSKKIGTRALWAITGRGASRKDVAALMKSLGAQHLEEIRTEAGVKDVFRKPRDRSPLSIDSRWMLVWQFDANEQLQSLNDFGKR